jgi:hypothetical protein
VYDGACSSTRGGVRSMVTLACVLAMPAVPGLKAIAMSVKLPWGSVPGRATFQVPSVLACVVADSEPSETLIMAPAVAVPLTDKVESLVRRSVLLTPRSSLIPPRLMETLPLEPPEDVGEVEPPELLDVAEVEPPELLEVAGSLTPTAALVVGRNWAAAAVAALESVVGVVVVEVDGVEVEVAAGLVVVVVVVVDVVLGVADELVDPAGTTATLAGEEAGVEVRPLLGAVKGEGPRTGPESPLPNRVPGGRRSSRTSSTGR